MSQRLNEYGQPIGLPMEGWSERPLPPNTAMLGRWCRVEKLDAERDGPALWEAYAQAPDGRDWSYLAVGPFADLAGYMAHARRIAASPDPLHHVIVDLAGGKPVGTAALMRIDRANGAIEVGWITYSPRLQRTPAGTEAMYLLMRRAFDELGYRRYEWKCDALNAPSRRAALRYGFTFEGVFRQAVVTKGRNRDTAWFSILDKEWPPLRAAFQAWLDDANFDVQGRQRTALSILSQPQSKRRSRRVDRAPGR
jgi:RimJ/RimL family protein N-acetyltransferase